MSGTLKKLLSGNEAIALGALHSGCALGIGYPGTPSSEILETFSILGAKAQWAPNEKVAAEVALGVAFAESSVLVTMKHVGFNVAQDLFFTASYSGIQGAYVAIVADDPGMASSQNEQDTRSLAFVGGLPVLEPSNSQEAYEFTKLAFELSREYKIPFIVRTTTRIAHTNAIVEYVDLSVPKAGANFTRDIGSRVMVPGNAKRGHFRLREKLSKLAEYNNKSPLCIETDGDKELGIISSGIAYMHALEAVPSAGFLKIAMSNPLPMEKVKEFCKKYKKVIVIEEGDPYMTNLFRAEGILNVQARVEKWRFGELNVDRVIAQAKGDLNDEDIVVKSKSPQLCKGCPHTFSFEIFKELDCIVAGDIGCYTLAAMIGAMDMQICMGASIGMGLGMRYVLPENQARRVVSVIGDSTFMHSGLTGLLDMVYNLPETGHVVVVVDNSTTAMTGQQEHPGTGFSLDGKPAHKVIIEDVAKAIGIKNVAVFNPVREKDAYKNFLSEKLQTNESTLIVLRQPCILAASQRAKSKNS